MRGAIDRSIDRRKRKRPLPHARTHLTVPDEQLPEPVARPPRDAAPALLTEGQGVVLVRLGGVVERPDLVHDDGHALVRLEVPPLLRGCAYGLTVYVCIERSKSVTHQTPSVARALAGWRQQHQPYVPAPTPVAGRHASLDSRTCPGGQRGDDESPQHARSRRHLLYYPCSPAALLL